MKIMFVTPYYEPSIGGVQHYVKDIVSHFQNHEIVIVTTKLNPDQPNFEQSKNIKIYRLPMLLKIANTPFHPFWKHQFKSIFRQEKPDIINAHAPVPLFADMAQRASKGTIPFVITYHSGSMKKNKPIPDSLIHIYERFVLPKTLRAASRIIAVYPDFIYRTIGNDRHIEFIPPGINTSFFKPDKTPKVYDIAFVGRLERASQWKGVAVALEAIASLKQKGSIKTLVVAGDGDAKQDYLDQAKALDIEQQVTFVGSLDRQGVRKTVRTSKVIVLPSLTESESFGMSVAEAASCGVPAIGSNIGGIPNVVRDGKTGLLVPPDDHEALADAMRKLVDDDKLRLEFGKAARKWIEERYSLKKFIEKTSDVIDQTLHYPDPLNVQVVAYYPPALGGMEQVAENMAIELVESSRSVEVVTSTIGYTESFRDINQHGYTVTRLPALKIAGLPILPTLLINLLREPFGSIFHVHVAQAFIPEIAMIAAKIRRGKFIVHFHLDVPASGRFGLLFIAYKKTLFPFMMRAADKVIVFSKEQRDLVTAKYGVRQSQIHILPNGIKRGFDRTKKRHMGKTPRILFVGRLSTQKNLHFLLDSLDGISHKLTTHIVGDGELKKELLSHSQSLGLKNITFTGRKDGDDLLEEYENADIFILPSEREGMPLVLIDAMAMRLPSVGSDVLGIRDLIHDGKNGFIVPLNDTTAMRKAILKIVSSPILYESMSESAYRTTRELQWSYLVQRLLNEVYT